MHIFDDAMHQLNRRGIALIQAKKIVRLAILYRELSKLYKTLSTYDDNDPSDDILFEENAKARHSTEKEIEALENE